MKYTVKLASIVFALTTQALFAELTVNIEREGAEKFSFCVEVSGEPTFAKSLRRNLELSGAFVAKPAAAASIKIAGATGGSIRAEGRGKALGFQSAAQDAKKARTEARLFADKLIETFAKQKGFSNDPIVFAHRKGRVSDIYMCYPDGYDMRKLTNDGREAVGPRWKDGKSIFYTGFLGDGGPKVYELDSQTGAKKLRWSFKGLTTGATISPDGGRVAIILSIHGNPELYVINIAAGTWTRLTNTRNASEGQPSWSPDGSQIVYVSDESRYPQLYVIDVATKSKRRLTSKGSQNVDPDWGSNGLVTYITKRGGESYVAIVDPKAGEASAKLVSSAGKWEHPSWARDGRHLVASRDGALFVLDCEENGDEPKRLFMNEGNWITPSWSR